MLLGRDVETQAISTLLDGARAGRSGVLFLYGQAGIGKTALLEQACGQADGLPVLRTTGVETEVELAFGALHQLLRPALPKLGRLAPPQRSALRCALGLESSRAPRDRFLIGLAVLTLLAEYAAAGPLLCLVDDVHWLDQPSRDALLFATRRLDTEGVAILAAAREPEPAGRGLPSLWIGPLDGASSAALLTAACGRMAPDVRDRILRQAGGNPLALRELGGRLDAAARAGHVDPANTPWGHGGPLDGFRRRIESLPAATRTLLLLAAAEDTGDLAAVLQAADSSGARLADLAPAETAGLVAVGRQIEFRHPLIRTAAYQGASMVERVAAHRALAALPVPIGVSDEDHADRSAWHLAAAAVGTDDRVAELLVTTARRAHGRDGRASAASAYERAAQLTGQPALRASRLVAAAEAAREAGQPERAAALADEAGRIPEAAEPTLLAALVSIRAWVESERGSGGEAGRLLLAGADLVRGAEPRTAAQMLIEAVRIATVVADAKLARSAADALTTVIAQADVDGVAVDDDPTWQLARAAASVAALFSGDSDGDLAAVRGLVAYAGAVTAGSPGPLQLAAASLGLVAAADVERTAAATIAQCRSHGRIGALPYALQLRAQALLLLGRHDEARLDAGEGRRIACDVGQEHRAAQLAGVLAWLAAVSGDEPACLEHARQCFDYGETRPNAAGAALTTWALGLLDLSRHRDEAAFGRLREVFDGPAYHPVIATYCAPDLVEAAVRLGRPEEAARPLLRLEEAAAGELQPWAMATALRCRAQVLSSAGISDASMAEDVEELYLAAVAAHPPGLVPHYLARTHLAYGTWLRRRRRRAHARVQLNAALEIFARIGAMPWVEHSSSELRATGQTMGHPTFSGSRPSPASEPGLGTGAGSDPGPVRSPAPGVLATALTPQETQVVRLAVQGGTNREIAAALFLSPRTVGFHLYRAFAKLGVSSRAELKALDLW
ncbi:MAG TPA: AAA family ATPase [Actinocrinis sp.]|nr:AAA family ATPase [Actinocrinis sp.]